MRILYLALDCPLPTNSGLHLRTWSVLQGLHEEGCRISLVCLQASTVTEPHAPLLDVCESFWILNHRAGSLSQGRDWARRLMAATSPLPYGALRFRSTAARSLLQRLCAGHAWDAVICDTAFAAINLPPEARPLVLNHHNIEHRILATYARVEPRRLKRAAARWECRKVQGWEARMGQRAALQLVCSNTDRERLLQQQPGACVLVAPNVVPPAAAALPGVAEDPELILFPAALDWLPNRDAVDFFLAEVWPLVRTRAPRARFVVAGRNPPPWFLARHRRRPGVEFTGTVADMAPHFERAAVVVVPLRIGSGTRLKILEAAARSKAVVSTPLGAEGLDLVAGEEILLADTPPAMAAAIVNLLGWPERRRAIGHAARARVRATYSPAALRCSLRQALDMLPDRAAERWPLRAAEA